MPEQTSETVPVSDGAPEWYVEHFLPFGYTVQRLEQAWAGLSDSARESYRSVLNSRPASTPAQEQPDA